MHRRKFIGGAAASFVTVGAASAASAQLGGLGGVLKKLPVPNLLGGKEPITTSLQDAKWGDASQDGFVPDEAARSLMELQRTPNAGFVLQPGYFQFTDQSYCLKAGTHGPGGGDGYLFAPPQGPAEDAVLTIVRNSVHRPEIPQQSIQQLLWAIIARAKFEDLSGELKVTASQLLTPRQIAQAEAQLRQMLTSPGVGFAEMERIAVLSGAAPLGPGSREVPSGRWSNHPDGYAVRYLPSGYSTTQVELWVPQGSPAVGKEYDAATHIAVPGNTARQRLIQSGRPQAA